MPDPTRPPSTTPSVADKHREHQLTRMLALSFDGGASPGLSLRALDHIPERHQPYGWGFAWYPDQSRGALVIKDPTSLGDNAMSKFLREWERFESTNFICHLRGAARTLSECDTQPFSRSYGGRDWVFAHNGDLRTGPGGLHEQLPLAEEGGFPLFDPVGGTDSEWAFCWLLKQAFARRACRLSEIGWDTLHHWFRQLDTFGTANFLISDGTDIVAYHDLERYNGLFTARLVPPQSARLETEDFVADLTDAGQRNRSVTLVSTAPLGGAAWQPLEAGRMVVLRRGAYIWDSHHAAHERRLWVAPVPDPVSPAGGQAMQQPQQAATQAPPPFPSTGAPPPPPAASVSPAADVPLPPATSAPPPSNAPAPAMNAPATTPQSKVHSAPLDLGDLSAWRRDGTRLLSVVHETSYRYRTAVERSTHLYRLKPVHDERQELLAHELSLGLEDLRREYQDVFGNATTYTEVETPYTEMSIVSRSIVRLAEDTRPIDSPRRRESIPLVWMPWQRQMMLPYLLPPELPETQLRELYDYAMSFVERQEHDLVQTLMDMNTTIYRDFKYVSGSTTLETTPFDVHIARQGVCQDFANLFICLARLLSIPARYRVGYIYTGVDYDNQLQSDASHAWVEAYLPWRGWVGFDPTNGVLAGLDHIRVACGRNYRDATPTSGTIYKGGGPEVLTVGVAVEDLEESDQPTA
ncbi:MAG: class II glutamine amidotransferase [Myxococcota bacterium]